MLSWSHKRCVNFKSESLTHISEVSHHRLFPNLRKIFRKRKEKKLPKKVLVSPPKQTHSFFGAFFSERFGNYHFYKTLPILHSVKMPRKHGVHNLVNDGFESVNEIEIEITL